MSPEPAEKFAVMVVDCPMYMELEEAVMVAVGFGGGFTVRVVEQLLEPAPLETVPVYVVELPGATPVDPQAPTGPT
jgi:hypothetical protein